MFTDGRQVMAIVSGELKKKRCTQLATESDQVYQLLSHGRWFSPGTLASSITKTGLHDIAEILLKVASDTINQIKKNNISFIFWRLVLLVEEKTIDLSKVKLLSHNVFIQYTSPWVGFKLTTRYKIISHIKNYTDTDFQRFIFL